MLFFLNKELAWIKVMISVECSMQSTEKNQKPQLILYSINRLTQIPLNC